MRNITVPAKIAIPALALWGITLVVIVSRLPVIPLPTISGASPFLTIFGLVIMLAIAMSVRDMIRVMRNPVAREKMQKQARQQEKNNWR